MLKWKEYVDLPLFASVWAATWHVWSSNIDDVAKVITGVFGSVFVIFRAINEIRKYQKSKSNENKNS